MATPNLHRTSLAVAFSLLGCAALPTVSFGATAIGKGSDEFNELGTGLSRIALTPVQISTGVKQVSAAKNTTYVLKTDGTLWSTGQNAGKLGTGEADTPRTSFGQVATNVASVAVGDNAVFWIKNDNTVWACGLNSGGDFTNGQTTPASVPTPVQVNSGFTRVFPIEGATLALKADKTLWLFTSWSPNGAGTLFASDVVDACTTKNECFYVTTAGKLFRKTLYAPIEFEVASNVKQVARGPQRDSAVFLKTDGSLSIQDENYVIAPVDTSVASVSGGLNHAVWVKTNGSLWGFGRNDGGQLGNTDRGAHAAPVQITTGVTQAVAGESQTFFIKPDASAWAVGSDNYGQLGRGLPLAAYGDWVPLRSGIRQVHAAEQRTQLVDTANRLWAAGSNANGELGDGTRNPSPSFKLIAQGVSKVGGISPYSSAYLSQTGDLYASGFNLGGGFGQPALLHTATPTVIASNVVDFSTGEQQSAVVKNDGSLWQAGFCPDGNPQTVFTAFATGVKRTFVHNSDTGFFIKNDNSLWAYGINLWGQFGGNGTNDSYVPVKVADNVDRADTDGAVSALLTTDGTLKIFGYNSLDLPTQSPPYIRLPQTVATNVVDFCLRDIGLVFVKKDGTAWHVGFSNLGHAITLGDGHSTTPIQIGSRAIGVSATRSHIVLLVRDPAASVKDFSGDAMPDVIWHNPWHRNISYVTLNDGRYQSLQNVGTLPDNAEIVGTADFTNDDRADLLARSPGTGNLTIWRIDGYSIVKQLFLGALPSAWRVGAIADFNGDGAPDIVSQNTSTGAVGYSPAVKNIAAPTPIAQLPAGASLVGAADFNRDGYPDLFVQNDSTGAVSVLLMSAGGSTGTVPFTTLPVGTAVAGVADYDGDTHPDILTYAKDTGRNAIHLHNGSAVTRVNGIGVSRDYYPKN